MAWFTRKSSVVAPEQSEHDKVSDEMTAFEALEDVPRDPRDWPSGKLQYRTYGNEGNDRYGDGATAKIGPAEVRHHADGSVSVGGKRVDDPSKYKGKPITGGIIDQLTKHAERNAELRKQEESADGQR